MFWKTVNNFLVGIRIIIILKKNFLWRSIVKYVLNLSTDNNCGWMLGIFFHVCNENLLVFVFCCFSRCCCYCCCCCCFLLAFKIKMPAIKSILTPLWVWMQIQKNWWAKSFSDSQTENFFSEMAKFAIHEVDMSEQDKVPTDVDTH